MSSSDCYTPPQHLPLHWLEPVDHEQGDPILPSFVDLQRKTLSTLYDHVDRDKSPKGSVDVPIRHLVDLINHHSHFSTLSSCSGRISLFDPSGDSDSKFTESSGKGRGTWRLVSHVPIRIEQLLEALEITDTTSDPPPSFQFEPMLLHIAAPSVARGQRLLQTAFACGFRESGLMVTSKRVTVALRSHALSLNVPMDGTLPQSYLGFLVDQANRKMYQNWRQLETLYQSLEDEFFQVLASQVPAKISTLRELPCLGLWNAATVVWEENSIYAFGGYGVGPTSEGARRWSSIHRLRLDREEQAWEKVVLNSTSKISVKKWQGLKQTVSSVSFPAVEGMAGVYFERLNTIILWGGRTNPTQPSNSLFLFDPELSTVVEVAGAIGRSPSPRWGHSLTVLNSETLIVCGGRDCGQGALNDIHLLHFRDGNFLWEAQETQLPRPRFSHTSLVTTQQNPMMSKEKTSVETLWIIGGDVSTERVLDGFTVANESTSPPWVCNIDTSLSTSRCTRLNISSHCLEDVSNKIGLASCHLFNGNVAIFSGGVGAVDTNCTSIHAAVLGPPRKGDTASIKSLLVRMRQLESHTPVNLGSLTHHACVKISQNQFAVVGGGAKCFAFGNVFAK